MSTWYNLVLKHKIFYKRKSLVIFQVIAKKICWPTKDAYVQEGIVWQEEEFQEESWSVMADAVSASVDGDQSPSTWTREESED